MMNASTTDTRVVKLYESFVGTERMRKMQQQFAASSFSNDSGGIGGAMKRIADKLPNTQNPCFCSNDVMSMVDRLTNSCFSSTDSLDTTGKSREWHQVMTSVSTGVMGTGVFLSTVSATYGEIKGSDVVTVLNRGLVTEIQTNLKRLGFDSWYNAAVVSGKSLQYTMEDTKRAKISNDRVRWA
jgi:hypothetical protein